MKMIYDVGTGPLALGIAPLAASDTAACSGVEWRAAADEDGHYRFAVALS